MASILDLLYSLGEAEIVTLPSGKVAMVREMTGAEQRNFSDRNKISNGSAIAELLAACTTSIDGVDLPTDKTARDLMMNGLLSGDRAALTFHIRKKSIGDTFKFKTECPEPDCHKETFFEVDLNEPEFNVTMYPCGDQRVIEYDSAINPAMKFRFTQLDGNAELKAIKNRNKASILTDLELRMPQIWDADNKTWTNVVVAKLTDKFITEMRDEIRKKEGFIDTTITVTCTQCSNEVKFDLLHLQDFMIPSVTS
jgi:hypothetical protein